MDRLKAVSKYPENNPSAKQIRLKNGWTHDEESTPVKKYPKLEREKLKYNEDQRLIIDELDPAYKDYLERAKTPNTPKRFLFGSVGGRGVSFNSAQ